MRGLNRAAALAVSAVINLPRTILVGGVKGYRWLLKPWLGNACRFEPTCSQYALTALQTHGALVGGTLAAGRLLRCHPWCDGGCDDVPAQPPAIFTRWGLTARQAPHRAEAAVKPADPSPSSVQEPIS